VSIGIKFSTHAGEGNLNDFFPEKGTCRIIAIRLMKSVQREVRLILATFLLTGRRHLKQKYNTNLPLQILNSPSFFLI